MLKRCLLRQDYECRGGKELSKVAFLFLLQCTPLYMELLTVSTATFLHVLSPRDQSGGSISSCCLRTSPFLSAATMRLPFCHRSNADKISCRRSYAWQAKVQK